MTNINYLVFIWNVFVDTLLLVIVYAWKMYDMQTLHAGGIPMFRGTYLVYLAFNSICDKTVRIDIPKQRHLYLCENILIKTFQNCF